MKIESGWAAVSAIVDGQCIPTPTGYDAETETRKLHVPYSLVTDAAAALVVCMTQGVIVVKLRRMVPEKAAVVYATTLATATPEN
jgi:hypothetical protein